MPDLLPAHLPNPFQWQFNATQGIQCIFAHTDEMPEFNATNTWIRVSEWHGILSIISECSQQHLPSACHLPSSGLQMDPLQRQICSSWLPPTHDRSVSGVLFRIQGSDIRLGFTFPASQSTIICLDESHLIPPKCFVSGSSQDTTVRIRVAYKLRESCA
jgi:hypothetical protein